MNAEYPLNFTELLNNGFTYENGTLTILQDGVYELFVCAGFKISSNNARKGNNALVDVKITKADTSVINKSIVSVNYISFGDYATDINQNLEKLIETQSNKMLLNLKANDKITFIVKSTFRQDESNVNDYLIVCGAKTSFTSLSITKIS